MITVMAFLILAFWIVGFISGIVAAIFFLELEDTFFNQPVRQALQSAKRRVQKVGATVKSIIRTTPALIQRHMPPRRRIQVVEM